MVDDDMVDEMVEMVDEIVNGEMVDM